MKMDMQIKALGAFVVASHNGREPATTDQIAPLIGVSAATAGLNNNFFVESGLLVRASKGAYKPTDEVVRFHQKWTFDPIAAGKLLQPAMRETWYFQAISQLWQMGHPTKEQVIENLAAEAGATKDHGPQLANVIEWLLYAGLATMEDGKVVALHQVTASDAGTGGETEKVMSTTAKTPGQDRAQEPVPTTIEAPRRQGAPVLTFDFALSLTSDDLAKLSPEQIGVLYEAVGKVAALKAALNKG